MVWFHFSIPIHLFSTEQAIVRTSYTREGLNFGAAGWYRTNILLRFKQALIYFSYSGNYLVPPHGIEPRPSALQAIVRTSYTREG